MDAYVIGIDIGTGSTKALAVTREGKTLTTANVAYPTLHPEPGYSEQDPQLIWQAVVTCIQRITTHVKNNPKAIVFSSAMHSVLPVDANGKPLMNLITWADNRSAAIAVHLRKSAAGEMLYEQSGTPIHAMTPLCKIMWIKENQPDLFTKTAKFISVKEFVWHALLGHYDIDHSLASATGLFDIMSRQWNSNALDLAGITTEKLSDPVETNFGRTLSNEAMLKRLGLSVETLFIAGGSDGCMANLGSFATEHGAAALTIGTSGAIRVGNATPTFNFEAMTFNYILDKNTFISGGPINNGGVVLKWYAERFLNHKLETAEDYDAIFNGLEKIAPGSEGLIFLPYILGERAPLWNSEACGVFFGMRQHHTQVHFTRAVIEGISMALLSVARAMEVSGLSIHYVNVSGGFVHSEVWVQLLADIFNKKINLVQEGDASAMGAAYLGLKTTGLIQKYIELQPKTITTYMPSPEAAARYASVFTRYERLYKILPEEMALATADILDNN